MIGYTVLNRSKESTLLLIHGLFASAGYWLPYLSSLKDHKLIILNIDYKGIQNFDLYVSRIVQIVEEAAGGMVKTVVSHSLGTFLASRLPDTLFHASIEICPVYAAKRKNQIDFLADIKRRVGFSASEVEIQNQLVMVDSLMKKREQNSSLDLKLHRLIPDADIYFEYFFNGPYTIFEGGHFEIEGALSFIR
jgi:hypothetical protein